MRHDKQEMTTEQKFVSTATQPRDTLAQRDLPARMVRQDRPEIQVEIQKARMIPVIPEQAPQESQVSETQITLERREPPVFIKPLRPSRVTEGKPVTLEVQFKGYPPPIISWYRDNFEIHPSHDFQILTTETNSTLYIPEVFPEDTGLFMVKAYNMYGTVQCKAKLTVVEEEETERDSSPEFRALLRDTAIMEGEPATFDCQVTGHPKPTVHWEKDGKPLNENPRWKFINEDDNYTLLIFEVKPEDAGRYDCVALNTVGKATCTANLNVELPIKQMEIPEPEKEIPVEAPQVEEHPQNVEVDEGEPVTFTCRFRGSPSPVVNWYRNNQLIKPSKYFRMDSTPDGTSSLSLLEAFPEDSGTYRCVARNKAGETSCSALLKVHGLDSEAEQPTMETRTQPPSFTKPITNTMVVEGATAVFEARFMGLPQPDITWLRNGLQVIQDSRNYKIERLPNSTTLTIKAAFPEDSGLITCRIKNISGTTECSAELYVQDSEEARLLEERYITTIKTTPPEFIKALTPVQELQPGSDARLEARVDAYPPPRFNWYINGKEIIPSDRRQVQHDKDTIILVIRSVQPEDQGDYTLRVQNEMGEITCRTSLTITGQEKTVALPYPGETMETMTLTSTTTTITREERVVSDLVKPEFTEALEPEIYVRERGIARLECKLDAYPPPLVTWYINGMEIQPSPHYEVLYDDGKSVLLIIEVGPEDTGEYTCRAVSELGEVVSSTTLYVQEPATEQLPATKPLPEDLASLQPSPSETIQPPRFVEPLHSIEAVDGEELRVPCKLTGKPPPQISFFHNGKNIDQDEEYVISYNPDTGEITLLIVEVFPEDEGEYVCIARNPAGEASTRMYLSVLDSGPGEFAPEDEMTLDQTEVKVTAQLPQTEVTEDDVVPKVIDRPKLQPLQRDDRPRSPSPTRVPQKEEIQPEEQPMEEEIFEEVLEPGVKPTVLDRPKKKPLVEEVPMTESPEREVPVLPMEKGEDVTDDARPVVVEEAVMKEVISKKIEIPEAALRKAPEQPISEKIDKDRWLPGQEPTARKPDVTPQTDTVIIPTATDEVPPEFVEDLQPQIVPDGEEVTLTCKVMGSPSPTVTWYKDGQELIPSTDFKIHYDEDTGITTLTIPEVFPEDAGDFVVRAENPFGEAATSANLVVHTMSDEDMEDTSTKFETTLITRTISAPEETQPDVIMESEKHITRLEMAPQFTKPLVTDLTVPEGGTARLNVEVAGEPIPKVTWYKNGITLTPTDRTVVVQERTTSTLTIDHVQPDDKAEYICVAENDRGVVTCKTTLHVTPTKRVEFEIPQPEKPERIRDQTIPKYALSEEETAPSASEDEIPDDDIKPPEFIELLHPITAKDGEKIVLTVKFRGFPQPRIRWYHNGREIQSSSDFQITIDYARGVSNLTISEVFPEDEGEYTCTARSKHGETITTCRLTVISEDEEIPSQETYRTTVKVQKIPDQTEEIPVHEVHTSRMTFQEIPVQDQPMEIPEETKYTEMIKLDHVPESQKPIVTKEMKPKGPLQFEIQIGRPSTTTKSVVKETTTYTTVTSEMMELPEEVPEIKEGDEHHKTMVTVHQEKKPVELKVQMPQPQDIDVTSTTHTIVTQEIKSTPVISETVPEEQHRETIEIVQDEGPQEVEFQVLLPTKETTKTEVTKTETLQTSVTERRQSVQKMEVEIKETHMQKTKPQQVELDVPVVKEVSSTEISVQGIRETSRPKEETVEVVRPTIEKVTEEKPEVPTVTEETTLTITTQEKPDIPVEEMVVTVPVTEVLVVDQKTEVEIDVQPQIKEEVKEVTTTTMTTKTTTQITDDKTHVEEITLDIKGEKPKPEEVVLSLQLQPEEKPKEEVPIEEVPIQEVEFKIQVPEVAPVVEEEEMPQVTSREVVVKEDLTEVKAPTDEVEVLERSTIEVVKKPETMEEVQIDIALEDTTPEVTTVKETEEVRQTVSEEVTFELPQAEETHKEQITLDIPGKPMDEVQLSFQVEAPEIKEIQETETVKVEEKEKIVLPEQEEVTMEIPSQVEEST
ncbi:hypothetical protein FSP39_007872 [Pinctada imbricata]|uniref:Ig-like domain-containing protein n=1 Tax=Pinctada imbricata TaxID=66713 RepID=A0AA88XTZ0_PINIB|nr:hypothetical protein FSP39_007872 [Pinctada imbricata]